MKSTVLGLALALVAITPSVALADGWIDCNGPDKNGRGCATNDGASAGAGLLLLAGVAYGLGRRRSRR